MSIYSKICIICNKDFKTMRISTLFCGRKCANRSRSLPVKIRESLIKRTMEFTLIEENRVVSKVKSDDSLLMALAMEEVKKRTKTRNEQILEDNLKYINKEDPALGDSDGFGVKGGDYDNNDVTKDNSSSSDSVVNDSDSNGIDEISQGRLASIGVGRGIRKLGGR